MRIVIVGGGKLGYHLATIMLDRKHDVRLIEKNKLRCMRLANELDVEVICGDGTEIETLEDAGTQNADCFIAVTGQDQDNLVASQLAKRQFKAIKVIARANDPRNMDALRILGADIVDIAEMHLLATLNKGRAGICTMTLPPDTALEGVTLKDVDLPESSLVISIVRGDAMMIPNGNTVIHANDEIVAVCEGKKQLLRVLRERK